MMYRIVSRSIVESAPLAFKTAKLDLDSQVLLESLFYYCLRADVSPISTYNYI